MLGYEEEFQRLLSINNQLTAFDLCTHLKLLGYTGSQRTVDRRLQEYRASKSKERFFAQEYEPGEQAQFDFKESFAIEFTCGSKEVNFHFGTLPYSNRFQIKAFPFKNFESFMDGVHSFYEVIGGMTKNIRFDNLSPCVKKIRSGSERIYTEAFDRAARYYGFGLLPCSPGKGNEKGDCERDIRTHARRIGAELSISGHKFEGFEDLNEWLLGYCRRHQAEKSKELFQNEQTFLRPLPRRDESILCRVSTSDVTLYGTVRIGTSSYSVPDAMIGRPCRIIQTPFEVVIREISGLKREIIHERAADCENRILLEHVLPSLVRKPGAMVRWAHRGILFPDERFRRYFDWLCQRFPGTSEREFLRSINLIQHTSLEDIATGIELIMESESSSPFTDLKNLLIGPGHRPNDQSAQNQQRLSPKLSMYDSLIPQPLIEESAS